jgi:hypothetical protein
MNDTAGEKTRTEAVGVFEDADSLQAAIDELLSAGFDRAELGLLASEHAVEKKLGHVYRRAAELEDDADVPRTAYVSKESLGDAEGGLIGSLMYIGAVVGAGAVVASGGALGAAVAAAAMLGGSGALMGAALARMIDDSDAERIEEQLDHGGLLLWVRTRDAAHEAKAKDILSRHSGQDVHLHQLTEQP